MAAFVLDASVAISWCFPGDPAEDTPYSRRVLKELVENDARRQDVAAYDAAYLDLSLRTGLPLATSDEPLRRAAIAQGITVLA
jgi:predicted nucleic acid-binding protein